MTDDEFAVQITLTVAPERQRAVVDALRAVGDPAQVPGLRGMTVLRSLDGTRVVNQLRWSSEAAFDAARARDPLVAATRAVAEHLVQRAETARYQVVEPG
jgi:heme-degrading monooxygenase HmoA